jgi:hypothetical protein
LQTAAHPPERLSTRYPILLAQKTGLPEKSGPIFPPTILLQEHRGEDILTSPVHCGRYGYAVSCYMGSEVYPL